MLTTGQKLPAAVRHNAQLRLGALKSSYNNAKSICVLTGRSRGVSRLFKLSRIKMRELGSLGGIPGLRKG